MSKMRKQKTKIHSKIEELEKQTVELQQALSDDLVVTKKKADNVGKILLAVTGGVVLSAIVLRGAFGGKGKGKTSYVKNRVVHRFKDQLLAELSSQALTFVLDLVSDKVKHQGEDRETNEMNDDPRIID